MMEILNDSPSDLDRILSGLGADFHQLMVNLLPVFLTGIGAVDLALVFHLVHFAFSNYKKAYK
jgi:hypothetical protein